MSKTERRFCKKCAVDTRHDRVKIVDASCGHDAMWIDHILCRGDLEEVYECQRCGNKSRKKLY